MLLSQRYGRYLGVSSGAALNTFAGDKYGEAKSRFEDVFQSCHRSEDRVARVWSVSGAFCTKPSAFALTDFIRQASTGNVIRINSATPVFRRYCAIEEVFAVTILGDGRRLFDSGGTRVEMMDLAEAVRSVVNPAARIVRASSGGEAVGAEYFSTNDDFEISMSRLGLEPMKINEQIANAMRGLQV